MKITIVVLLVLTIIVLALLALAANSKPLPENAAKHLQGSKDMRTLRKMLERPVKNRSAAKEAEIKARWFPDEPKFGITRWLAGALQKRLKHIGERVVIDALNASGAVAIGRDDQNRTVATLDGITLIVHRFSIDGVGCHSAGENDLMVLAHNPQDKSQESIEQLRFKYGRSQLPDNYYGSTRMIWMQGYSVYKNITTAIDLAQIDTLTFYQKTKNNKHERILTLETVGEWPAVVSGRSPPGITMSRGQQEFWTRVFPGSRLARDIRESSCFDDIREEK